MEKGCCDADRLSGAEHNNLRQNATKETQWTRQDMGGKALFGPDQGGTFHENEE